MMRMSQEAYSGGALFVKILALRGLMSFVCDYGYAHVYSQPLSLYVKRAVDDLEASLANYYSYSDLTG